MRTDKNDPIITGFQEELIENTAADLRALSVAMDVRASKHDIRRVSTMIRIIAEGSLRNAWRYVGLPDQPRIPCQSFIDGFAADFAFIGGAIYYDPRHDGTAWISDGIRPVGDGCRGCEFIAINPNVGSMIGVPGNPALRKRELRLDDFWIDPTILIQSLEIDRRTITKYVANRRGGAHLTDGGGKGDMVARFDALDLIRSGQHPAAHAVPIELAFYALMSIARDLVDAPDIQRFLIEADRLTSTSPNSFGRSR